MPSAAEAKTSNLKIIFAYGLMIVGVVLAYLVIRWYGEGLNSSEAVGVAKTSAWATEVTYMSCGWREDSDTA